MLPSEDFNEYSHSTIQNCTYISSDTGAISVYGNYSFYHAGICTVGDCSLKCSGAQSPMSHVSSAILQTKSFNMKYIRVLLFHRNHKTSHSQ